MKITKIEVVTLRHEYPAGKGFKFAGGYCNGRLSSLVFVYTDTDLTGLGSIYSHPELVACIIENHLQDVLLGRDPLQIEEIWNICCRLTRWYGRKGAAISAIGGIDTALWDIRGKIAGKPISELLGARRQKVPVYASALLWKDDVQELGHEAARYLSEGHRGMKMRLGRNYEYDRAAVRIVRDVIGPETRLMIEGNARYDVLQAKRIACEYRSANVFWFEEPFPPERTDDYLALRGSVGIPLAAGENEFGLQGFRELVDGGLVDIVQPDCSRSGGISEGRRIGALAAKHGLGVATHTWNDAVALVANIHLIASLPHGVAVEMDRTGNPFIDDLLTVPLKVVDGEISVPQGAGLGIELNPETLKRLRVPRFSPIAEGNYSDMVFGNKYFTPAPAYEQPIEEADLVEVEDTSTKPN